MEMQTSFQQPAAKITDVVVIIDDFEASFFPGFIPEAAFEIFTKSLNSSKIIFCIWLEPTKGIAFHTN